MKILLDTDIGCDIDDCFALAYLLSCKNLEILGITTTTGKPHLRAQLAHKICKTAGKNVPVFVGNEMNLSGECLQPILTWNEPAVAESSDEKYENSCSAVEFLRQTIEANPNEITLIAIGPLTNVAMLFNSYPHIPALLKGMVIMGGRFVDDADFDFERWGKTEWNILCDKEAAKTVFEGNVKPTVVAGIEQTVRFFVDSQKIRQGFLENKKFGDVGVAIGDAYKHAWFHDVVTIYAFLHPEEVTTEKGNVSVLFEEDCTKTIFTPDKDGNYQLLTDFSLEKFRKNYAETVGIEISCLTV